MAAGSEQASAESDPKDFLEALLAKGHRYAGFSLVIADVVASDAPGGGGGGGGGGGLVPRLWFGTNAPGQTRGSRIKDLSRPGTYALTNDAVVLSS